MSHDAEVVILGAGPAGLALATELSRSTQVCVLERAPIGQTTATWYSYGDRVRAHALEEAVEFECDEVIFQSPSLTHHLRDECVVLNHRKVLSIWHSRALNQGVRFVQGSYLSHEVGERAVRVRSTAGDLTSRVLVDCSGSGSPIVAANQLVARKDAWVLWGARVRLPSARPECALAYIPLGDDMNTYLGVHPFSATELNVYVFQGHRDTMGEPRHLEQIFERTLNERYPGAVQLERLGGTIVSGVLKRRALDRVVFFGAAGMMNPEAIGMGFNEILRRVDTFAAGLRDALASDRLSAHNLAAVVRATETLETLYFQRVIGAFSLNFVHSEDKWDGGVRWLNSLGAESSRWMRNEFDLKWIQQATLSLHRAVPLRSAWRNLPLRDFAFVSEQLARFAGRASWNWVCRRWARAQAAAWSE